MLTYPSDPLGMLACICKSIQNVPHSIILAVGSLKVQRWQQFPDERGC